MRVLVRYVSGSVATCLPFTNWWVDGWLVYILWVKGVCFFEEFTWKFLLQFQYFEVVFLKSKMALVVLFCISELSAISWLKVSKYV